MDEKSLRDMVRSVVLEILEEENVSMSRDVEPKSGVMSVKGSTIKTEPFPFDIGPAGRGVFLKDIVSLEESPRIGIGFMEMRESSFPWTLRYDEADYIIEGTLDIIVNGRTIRGNAGDVLFIPKDSSIEFSAPHYAKFMYVTYPADWSNQ